MRSSKYKVQSSREFLSMRTSGTNNYKNHSTKRTAPPTPTTAHYTYTCPIQTPESHIPALGGVHSHLSGHRSPAQP